MLATPRNPTIWASILRLIRREREFQFLQACQLSTSQMPHPGLLLGLFAAKKAIAVTVYYALKRYGFGRAYRRALEANKRITPRARQNSVAGLIKQSFYLPTKAAEALKNSDVFHLLTTVSKELKGKGVLGKAEGYLAQAVASGQAAAEFFGALQKEVENDRTTRRPADDGANAGAGTLAGRGVGGQPRGKEMK